MPREARRRYVGGSALTGSPACRGAGGPSAHGGSTRSVSATGTGDGAYPGAPAQGGGLIFDSAGVYAYDAVPPGGSNTQLFTSAGTQVTALGTFHVGLSSWSPDGSKLVFETRWNDQGNNIDVAGSDGSNKTSPTHLHGGALHPAWSPDGTKIAYANEGGTIATIPAIGGSIQTITPDWPTAPSAPYYIEPDWAETGGPNLQGGTATKTKVTENAKGNVTLPIENPNGVPAQGDLKLVGQNLHARVVAAKHKKGKKVTIKLGHTTFTVPAHGTAQVKVHLSKKARAYLKKHKSIKAKGTIVLKANGTSKTNIQTITVKAPKKKKKP